MSLKNNLLYCFLAFCGSVHAQASANGYCYDSPFANEVAAATVIEYVSTPLKKSKEFPDTTQVAGPFPGQPPEIQNIERGAVSQYIGGYTNDGISSWLGVDLDSQVLISISRRVWDRRSPYTRFFEFPDPKTFPPEVSVRTWIKEDGSRKELEIIRRANLARDEQLAFVCAANVEWSLKRLPSEVVSTDTLSRFLQLRNFGQNVAGKHHVKAVQEDGVTAFAMQAILARREIYWKN